jgi:hypothetical protein
MQHQAQCPRLQVGDAREWDAPCWCDVAPTKKPDDCSQCGFALGTTIGCEFCNDIRGEWQRFGLTAESSEPT